MSFIIVEIPHQLPAAAWIAWREKDIISMAYESENMTYQEWTLDSALDCFGELEDIPGELIEILRAEGKALEFGYTDGSYTQWFNLEEAPNELDAAKEALFHDLSDGFVLSEEEARSFISDSNNIYRGHKCIEARIAVRKILSDYFD